MQSVLDMVNNLEKTVRGTEDEQEDTISSKSIQGEPQNLTDRILDSLIDVQSALSAALQSIEDVDSVTNGATNSQKLLASSDITVCLVELRQYVSDVAHIAMTLKEDQTLNSLLDVKEPLMDLQEALVSKERTFQELEMIRKISIPIEKLKVTVSKVLFHCQSQEAINSIKDLSTILEEIETQLPKTEARLVEAEEATKHYLQSLNTDQNLSNVHFALSSALERHERSFPAHTSSLTICVEDLRQNIGSTAVAIANLKNPIDEQIVAQVYLLKDSLLSLQRSLLTQEHEPEEEQILKDLLNPIEKLKSLIQKMVDSKAKTDLILPVLELLEEIEKDTPLIAKEASKKKARREAEKLIPKKEEPKEEKIKSFALANRINRSLDPMKHWLSTISDDSAKDEEESVLSSTVEDLKRDVNKIAIETSYSEPPSDENLIEALTGLREPLTRLRNAISMYHEPADLSTLEGLSRPMKYLLQTVMDVLGDHAEEESLRPIIDIVEEIENQIPISIKEVLYKKELKEMVKSMTQEEKEIIGTMTSQDVTIQEESIPLETIIKEKEEIISNISQETIPEGTLMESTTVLPETQFTESIMEQTIGEEISSQKTEQLLTTIEELPKGKEDAKKIKKEEEMKNLIFSLSKTLDTVQMDMTSILEDFEEPTTGAIIVPVSLLANSLEEFRKTISSMQVTIETRGKSVESREEIVNETVSIIQSLVQPLNNLQKVLQQSHQHGARELVILNHLILPLNVIETEIINYAIQKLDQNSELKKNWEPILNLLRDIKDTIPIIVKDIHSRQELLGFLREVLKPLKNIEERMKILENQAEDTLETDVARILVEPLDHLLNTINITSQELELLDQRRVIIVEFRSLVGPLVEFLSSLSMVQSSRKSLVPEGALLDERRSVISKAVEGLQRQASAILDRISNLEGATMFESALNSLKNASISVLKQIGKTDYSRRSSTAEFTLQYNLSTSFNHLKNTIATLEKSVDKPIHEIIIKSLEGLQKQITLSETHFMQTYIEQRVDEEAIVEGFLYPTNQLRSALNTLKEKIEKKEISMVSSQSVTLFQALANSTTELASSLSLHRAQLIREGESEGSSLVETLSAMVDVLESVKGSIIEIDKMINVEKTMTEKEKVEKEKDQRIEEQNILPITITQIETIIDEIIEVSKEEVESVLTIEKLSPEKEMVTIEEMKSESEKERKSVSKIDEDNEESLMKKIELKATEKIEILEGMKEEKTDDFQDVKTEKIDTLKTMKEEKAEIIEEIKEEKMETLEEMKEKKIIAPEVPKEIQLESLEKITEQKVEMHEATQKKEEIKTIEEKIEDIERKREEKVETEGMAEEKIKILEEKITEQEQEQKIETIEIMEENKIQSLEEIKEKKMEDLNVKKEKKTEAIPKTEESLQTEKIEILSEKTNEIIKKEEEIEALIKTKEEIIEKKEIVEGKIIEEDKKIEILEKKEKVEEQVQEKKEIEITKADEIKIEEESERVEENEENTEKKKVIEIKEYSDETVSPKVEKEIIESLIEKIEEQKEIEESHERIEENLEILPQEDEELTQKQKKFEKTELIIKKEESVEILAEKIEELAIKEEKVDILSETPQELEKIVEKVEVSPEDNQMSLIKEEKPEILIAKTEEIIKVPDNQ